MTPAAGDLGRIRASFTEAALAGDRRIALRLAEDALAAAPALDVYTGLIEASQVEVGARWQDNRITVAQEHIATAVTQYVVSVLYQRLPLAPPNGQSVLISGVEGELHQLGPQLVADALEMDGCRVRFLGCNVPLTHLVQQVTDDRPDVVGLSTMMIFNVPKARFAIEQIGAALSPRPTIVVGGGAFRVEPDLWKTIGADAYAADVRDAVAVVRELRRYAP
jgi:MerR family transcriptional regulator, light-induced transcriptional regulator